jgi:hypothetical protein
MIRNNAARNGNEVMHLPFFYGWLIVVVTFVTMAIGVNARTAFRCSFRRSSASLAGIAASRLARFRSALWFLAASVR